MFAGQYMYVDLSIIKHIQVYNKICNIMEIQKKKSHEHWHIQKQFYAEFKYTDI